MFIKKGFGNVSNSKKSKLLCFTSNLKLCSCFLGFWNWKHCWVPSLCLNIVLNYKFYVMLCCITILQSMHFLNKPYLIILLCSVFFVVFAVFVLLQCTQSRLLYVCSLFFILQSFCIFSVKVLCLQVENRCIMFSVTFLSDWSIQHSSKV